MKTPLLIYAVHEHDAFLLVNLIEPHFDDFGTAGLDVPADELCFDRHFPVAPIDQYTQGDALGAAEVKKTVHRRPDGPARVEHVVDENQVHAVHGKRDVRRLQNGLRRHLRKIVSIQRDVEGANRHIHTVYCTHALGDALGKGYTAAPDADQDEMPRATALFYNFVCQTLQGSVDLSGRHQLCFFHDAHVRVILTQGYKTPRYGEGCHFAGYYEMRPSRTRTCYPLDEVSAVDATSRGRTPADVDLSVSIGALRLRNPVFPASGTFGYGVEFAHLVDLNTLGAFVTKGLSREPIDGAPAPRLCETPSGMLNAVGLQNVGVQAFIAEKLPILRQFDVLVIANVFGFCVEDYVEVIRWLEDADGVAGYELNISCPNTKSGGMQFGGDPALVAEVVAKSRAAAVRRPLWVKLSPLVANIGLIAKTAEEAGADALTVANTYPAMALDSRTGKSRLGNLTGGLSGPAIKPITLRLVWESKKVVKIPIIGLGGVETVSDVLDYLSVGASSVQVGTTSFTDPRASERLNRQIREAIFEANTFTLNEIKDRFLQQNG